MKTYRIVCLLSLSLVIVVSLFCASTTTVTAVKSSSKKTALDSTMSDECKLMQEVCDEALDFQKEYDRLPQEQQKEMDAVLNTYIEHCEQAKIDCENSKKNKR
ncbi:MAG: hypothetical protein JW795_22730 [Chitinivibrionales bacterium]|nr:hypothetical protein [Chitinivibrionales bacterium]